MIKDKRNKEIGEIDMITQLNNKIDVNKKGTLTQAINADDIAKSKESTRVLLVEDQKLLQFIHNDFLTRLGCTVDIAGDGFEAVNMFTAGYDLVLLDIELPSRNGIAKNGIDVARAIRSLERLKKLNPTVVIALTALDDSIRFDCLNAGCDDFYQKPLEFAKLQEVLQCWLGD